MLLEFAYNLDAIYFWQLRDVRFRCDLFFAIIRLSENNLKFEIKILHSQVKKIHNKALPFL